MFFNVILKNSIAFFLSSFLPFKNPLNSFQNFFFFFPQIAWIQQEKNNVFLPELVNGNTLQHISFCTYIQPWTAWKLFGDCYAINIHFITEIFGDFTVDLVNRVILLLVKAFLKTDGHLFTSKYFWCWFRLCNFNNVTQKISMLIISWICKSNK